MNKNKKILLTGAGFTANFGAPVASQVWNALFNNVEIQKSRRLKEILKRHQSTSDFEGFYDEAIYRGDTTVDEKRVIITSVIEIYNRINAVVEQYFVKTDIDFGKLFQFLKLFSNMSQGKGFIFTLNQDLFLEKLVNSYLRLQHYYKNFSLAYPLINVPYIDSSWRSVLPTQDEIDDWLSRDNLGGTMYFDREFPWYIKLHGSSGWINNNNKLSVPVIGRNKSQQISSQPLLKWYMDIFDGLLEESLDIWVIGYSLTDKHINESLIKSINRYKSSLFVIDIKPQNQFIDDIRKVSNTLYMTINEGLSGYFPCGLNKIFPLDNQQTFYQQYFSQSLKQENEISILEPVIELP